MTDKKPGRGQWKEPSPDSKGGWELGPILALAPAALGAWLVWNAFQEDVIKLDKLGQDRWTGDDFANLAWLALVTAVVVFAAAVRKGTTPTLTVLGITSLGLSGCAIGAFVLAFSIMGRQNYWAAYHFSVLAWTAFGSCGISLASFSIASRRGSITASSLVGVAGGVAFLLLVIWCWTWSPWVQDLEGWIARTFWLKTHG